MGVWVWVSGCVGVWVGVGERVCGCVLVTPFLSPLNRPESLLHSQLQSTIAFLTTLISNLGNCSKAIVIPLKFEATCLFE